jgi:uncharacterized protein VirK/YbjX
MPFMSHSTWPNAEILFDLCVSFLLCAHCLFRESFMSSSLLKHLLASGHFNGKDLLKVWTGFILFPIQTRRWITFLNNSPMWKEALHRNGRHLYTKIHKGYLMEGLRPKGRLDAIIQHCDMQRAIGLEQFAWDSLRTSHTLFSSKTKNDLPVGIYFSTIHEGHREGELCLHLYFIWSTTVFFKCEFFA